MYVFTVSWLGVILATVASMALGMLWYSPALFGKKWMALVGMTPDTMSSAKKSAKNSYIISTVLSLVMAYVIAVLLHHLVLISLLTALKVGLLMWLGFAATSMANEYIFAVKPKPWSLYAINAGYVLASILLQTAVIYLVS